MLFQTDKQRELRLVKANCSVNSVSVMFNSAAVRLCISIKAITCVAAYLLRTFIKEAPLSELDANQAGPVLRHIFFAHSSKKLLSRSWMPTRPGLHVHTEMRQRHDATSLVFLSDLEANPDRFHAIPQLSFDDFVKKLCRSALDAVLRKPEAAPERSWSYSSLKTLVQKWQSFARYSSGRQTIKAECVTAPQCA